jgi:negative regulator of flagellin synthesis FlgM
MIKDINSLVGLPPNSGANTKSSGQTAKADQQATASNNTEAATVSDKVELSSQASNFQAAEELVQSLPDINEARVAEIKAALANDTLIIDNQSIANNMLSAESLF